MGNYSQTEGIIFLKSFLENIISNIQSLPENLHVNTMSKMEQGCFGGEVLILRYEGLTISSY